MTEFGIVRRTSETEDRELLLLPKGHFLGNFSHLAQRLCSGDLLYVERLMVCSRCGDVERGCYGESSNLLAITCNLNADG
jgi:hypothetical protein